LGRKESGKFFARGLDWWNHVEPEREFSFFVIPGRAKREPGIHSHDREFGFLGDPNSDPSVIYFCGRLKKAGEVSFRN
jgi:hypothetical protein